MLDGEWSLGLLSYLYICVGTFIGLSLAVFAIPVCLFILAFLILGDFFFSENKRR